MTWLEMELLVFLMEFGLGVSETTLKTKIKTFRMH